MTQNGKAADENGGLSTAQPTPSSHTKARPPPKLPEPSHSIPQPNPEATGTPRRNSSRPEATTLAPESHPPSVSSQAAQADSDNKRKEAPSKYKPRPPKYLKTEQVAAISLDDFESEVSVCDPRTDAIASVDTVHPNLVYCMGRHLDLLRTKEGFGALKRAIKDMGDNKTWICGTGRLLKLPANEIDHASGLFTNACCR